MNLRLRTKLLVMVAIPLLGMLWVSAWNTVEKGILARDMARLQGLVDVSTAIGALVHELQKERGMSAGFLGSKGANFRDELTAQRKNSDKQSGQLQTALAGFDASHFAGSLDASLAEAKRMLGDLPAKRDAVSALGIPGPEAIGYYTKTIAALLAVPANTATLARVPEVSKLASSYGAYLQAKERAGIERALLSNVLGTDRFAPDMLVRFLSNAAVQDTWFGVFESYATDSQRTFHKSKVVGPAVDEVVRVKKAAIEKMGESSLGMDAKEWFKAATGRIDLLKEVESRLASDLTGSMAGLEKEAKLTAWGYGFVTILATVLILWMARAFSRTIVGQIGGEPETAVEVAHAVAGGKLDNEIELRPGDATSILASMRSMQEQLLARTETERRQANESLRIKIALDNVSTGVMIADTDRNIIYTNRSVHNLLKAAEADIRKELPSFDADRLVGTNIDGFHKNPA
ncbi:MAG TPA: nitrate- and nitrite sensing domain-containing protein, partial [Rhodocyclaceae bacterium]|nr:nitrate- and nitrite sensing domain-containing protein [Rhodocyclaceae bacterium]